MKCYQNNKNKSCICSVFIIFFTDIFTWTCNVVLIWTNVFWLIFVLIPPQATGSFYKAHISLKLHEMAHQFLEPTWTLEAKLCLFTNIEILQICGAFHQKITHLKYDNPSIGNVIEVDGTFVRVTASCVTSGVVLIPVDTQTSYTVATVGQRFRAQSEGLTVQDVLLIQAAGSSSFAPGWDIWARHDAIVHRQGADERPLIILSSHVVRPREAYTRSPERV